MRHLSKCRRSYEGLRLFGLAIVQHARGENAESDVAVAALIEKFGELNPALCAAALAVRGEVDRAFTWLNKAADVKDPALNRLPSPFGPMFENLRADPRWLPFLESIGRAPEQLAEIEFNVRLPGL